MAIRHFLLIYNIREARLEHLERFETDRHRATEAYAQAEERYRDRADQEDFEIVLVGADSLDTVKITHSRYFEEPELVPFS